MATTVGRLSDILVSFIVTVVFVSRRWLLSSCRWLLRSAFSEGKGLKWKSCLQTPKFSPPGELPVPLEDGLGNIHETVPSARFSWGWGQTFWGISPGSPNLSPNKGFFLIEKSPSAFQKPVQKPDSVSLKAIVKQQDQQTVLFGCKPPNPYPKTFRPPEGPVGLAQGSSNYGPPDVQELQFPSALPPGHAGRG
uniref:Uncharacterized protein n=1 Tax=Sphaerodactylus townsendi TaxID=933632 RepID=A0ACB8EC41_9SAUR